MPYPALLLALFAGLGGLAFEAVGLARGEPRIMPLALWLIAVAGVGAVLVLAARRSEPGAAAESGAAWGSARLDAVLDAATVGLAVYDANGRLALCNARFRDMFAAPTESGAGLLQGGASRRELKLPDGRWVHLERSDLADGGWVLTTSDISGRRSAEAAGRLNEERYRQSIAAIGDWIWETDVLNRFVRVMPVAGGSGSADMAWMIGLDLAELAGRDDTASQGDIEDCIHDMTLHRRLRDVTLLLQDGSNFLTTNLHGVPRFDESGAFLGYRGVGSFRQSVAPSPDGAEAVKVEPSARRAARGPAEGHLLLVDDSETNRRLAAAMLSKMGYEVETASSGAEAIERIRAGGCVAVLMDIWMPEMDGFEATAAIRALPPPLSDLPVIAMTAHASSEDRQRCLAAGMDDHVGKPIDRPLLASIVRRLAGPPPNESQGPSPVESERPATPDFVDDGVLEQLCNDAGPALVGELIGAYMAETDDRIERMSPSLESGDLEAVAAEAHSLKSSSGTFGALPLQAHAARLEAAAMQRDAKETAALLESLPALIEASWSAFGIRGYRKG